MAAMHERQFTVRGRGEFPLDMLRYDRCWPRTGQDVELITPLYASDTTGEHMRTRDVDLCKHTATKRGPVAAVDRWLSFGWKVVRQD